MSLRHFQLLLAIILIGLSLQAGFVLLTEGAAGPTQAALNVEIGTVAFALALVTTVILRRTPKEKHARRSEKY